MTPAPELPSPSEWGWNKKSGGGWSVTWTTLPEASEACRELLRCGCKMGTPYFLSDVSGENKLAGVRVFFSFVPCFIFLYINCVMLYTLRSKTVP
ncbi:hypothetical protein N1851_034085 [Merluccius polli]|uniref:Uncharacterized protein n=1 Tax=Merluccius polli TaxID=89951 RepID=A0AA47M099_MERPO|nr:hypothetical protein N1851_034085 [Merluccius polli]